MRTARDPIKPTFAASFIGHGRGKGKCDVVERRRVMSVRERGRWSACVNGVAAAGKSLFVAPALSLRLTNLSEYERTIYASAGRGRAFDCSACFFKLVLTPSSPLKLYYSRHLKAISPLSLLIEIAKERN